MLLLITVATFVPVYAWQIGVVVTKSSSYLDQYGNFHVIGEVRNDALMTKAGIIIDGTFYDNNYSIVGTNRTYAQVEFLHPGAKAPFHLVFADPEKTKEIYGYLIEAVAAKSVYSPDFPEQPKRASAPPEGFYFQPVSGIDTMSIRLGRLPWLMQDADAISITRAGTGYDMVVETTLTNKNNVTQSYTALMEIRDSKGITQYTNIDRGEVEALTAPVKEYSWHSLPAGSYELRLMVISSTDEPELLAPVAIGHVTIPN